MRNDPIDTRGREQREAEEEARKKLLRATEIEDVKWLMASKRGRRIMWRLLGLSRVFRLSFDPNAMKMAFNEGSRSLGNQLLEEVMDLCQEMFPVMMKENQNARGSNRDGSGDNPN